MTTEELKKSFEETNQPINAILERIKKSDMKDSMKIEYMEKLFKLKENHLLAVHELAIRLNDLKNVLMKQIELLNNNLDWAYYERRRISTREGMIELLNRIGSDMHPDDFGCH